MQDRRKRVTFVAYLRLMVATLLLLVDGIGQPFAQTNSFLQQTTVPTQGLNTSENVRYLRTPPSAAVVIQTGIIGQNGQSIELCKTYPGLQIQMLPDTPYFAAMIDASLHGRSFVDPDTQKGGMPLYSAISFVASGTCDANGLVHIGDFPALPWIVTAMLPQKLPGTNGDRIVVHTILLANATTNVSLSQKDIVSSTDTVSAGLPFDFSAVRAAFGRLPMPSAEGLAAEQALSAIDRGDMQGAAVATMHYIDACVRNKMCSDSLKLSMQQEFESNRPWFEFFGTLATAGIAGDFLAGKALATAATEEEIGLSRIGQAFGGSAPVTASQFAEISTLQEIATQSLVPEALAARAKVEEGATLYRIGTMGRSDAADAQYWALENPTTPGYATRHGIPAANVVNSDFVETATLKPGTPFITRPAPGVGGNLGGAIEVVVPRNGVTLRSFGTH